ncbi:MAG TPA: aminotransferase class V-fold PLP-dependent enzyme [Verrucomicrobiae bacterium]|nr:aminotransferase class V-fold PLP-dependent enzyme [Verrucomicrobiae bacterium]
MTLSEILGNEELRRREFPVARDKVFLAHAGVCPLPRRVAGAVRDCAEKSTLGDQEEFMLARLTDARKLGAQLLNCRADEIALVGPTSLALSFVAAGLKLRRNDNILIYHDDYPSNVYPWMALADQGVEVRLLNTRGLGNIRPRDVAGQIDENTKLVALASCHFISGFRIEISEIGKMLHGRGIWFCLDAIQTLGAFPTTVEHVDFLAADAHKWLLGPCGAGILYVRRDLQERLTPPVYGWHNVRNPHFVAQEHIVFRDGAVKYEAGTQNLLGAVGLVAAMELSLELGIENIAAELLRKRNWLAPELQKRGFTVLNADAGRNSGSITSFFHGQKDMAGLFTKLSKAGVVPSLRTDRAGKKYLRFSPHFYNTDAELHRALDLL